MATTPDLAALAREIGGDPVNVKALAKPTEDPHFVDAKPSHIVTLNRADVLIEGGAELELGWLPPLLESARNGKIAAGAPGRIVASQGIKMLEVPADVRSLQGGRARARESRISCSIRSTSKIVAAHIADHLAQVDPAGAETFKANLKRFNAAVDAEAGRVAEAAGAVSRRQDRDLPQGLRLSRRSGSISTIVETLEPKPGIAPSPAHLAQVISAMKAAKARVILVQPYQNRKTAETVARQTDADRARHSAAARRDPEYRHLLRADGLPGEDPGDRIGGGEMNPGDFAGRLGGHEVAAGGVPASCRRCWCISGCTW